MERSGSGYISGLVLVAALILCNSSCLAPVVAQCSSSVQLTANGSPRLYDRCSELTRLGSSLAWTYNATTQLFDFAFRTRLPNADGWAGWAIHPTTASRMIGASSLIAFNGANGTNLLPYYLSGQPSPPSAIDLEVVNGSTAVFITSDSDGTFATFGATLRLDGQTTLYHLWNVGGSVNSYTPNIHSLSGDNMLSYGVLNLATGTAGDTSIAHIDLKNSHGIINAVSWGIMFPLGVMAARYMRPFKIFDPLWFFVHVGCQVTAYILGVVGWGLGLRLGSYATVDNAKHWNLGVAMFTLATLQITALALRPKPDHEYRKYWNVYHHLVGFTLVILSIINIFEGIDLLAPDNGWKVAYVIILITMAAVALVLEVGTWAAWYSRRNKSPTAKLGAEEGQGNGSRPGVENSSSNQQWAREPQL